MSNTILKDFLMKIDVNVTVSGMTGGTVTCCSSPCCGVCTVVWPIAHELSEFELEKDGQNQYNDGDAREG